MQQISFNFIPSRPGKPRSLHLFVWKSFSSFFLCQAKNDVLDNRDVPLFCSGCLNFASHYISFKWTVILLSFANSTKIFSHEFCQIGLKWGGFILNCTILYNYSFMKQLLFKLIFAWVIKITPFIETKIMEIFLSLGIVL